MTDDELKKEFLSLKWDGSPEDIDRIHYLASIIEASGNYEENIESVFEKQLEIIRKLKGKELHDFAKTIGAKAYKNEKLLKKVIEILQKAKDEFSEKSRSIKLKEKKAMDENAEDIKPQGIEEESLQEVQTITTDEPKREGEQTMTDEQIKQAESLTKDADELLQKAEELESRARKIRSEVSIASLDPTDNYSFAKQVIDGELTAMATSLSEMKKLVFVVQDRQERMYHELKKDQEGRYRELKEDGGKIDAKIAELSQQTGEKISALIEEDRKDKEALSAHVDRYSTHTSQLESKIKTESSNVNNRFRDLAEADKNIKIDIEAFKRAVEEPFHALSQYLVELSRATGKYSDLSRLDIDDVLRKMEHISF